MSESLKAAIRSAVLRLLDPLVKWLLEAGMGVGDLLPLVKIADVRAAREQGRRSSGELKRPNANRSPEVRGLALREDGKNMSAKKVEAIHGRRCLHGKRMQSARAVEAACKS